MLTFSKFNENFQDGKNPQDKGDMARHGLKGKSIAQLKKVRSSPSASPRKKQLAHWFINMHEAKEKEPISTKTISGEELVKHIGKTKMKAIAKHPFHRDYLTGSYLGHSGVQFHRDRNGFEHVLASHSEPLKNKEGKSLRKMVKYDLRYKGHGVSNAHLFHNWNNERHENGQPVWNYVKSHKKDEGEE